MRGLSPRSPRLLVPTLSSSPRSHALLVSSFPRSAWERPSGRSASRLWRVVPRAAERRGLRSHAERGNEETANRLRWLPGIIADGEIVFPKVNGVYVSTLRKGNKFAPRAPRPNSFPGKFRRHRKSRSRLLICVISAKSSDCAAGWIRFGLLDQRTMHSRVDFCHRGHEIRSKIARIRMPIPLRYRNTIAHAGRSAH